MAGVALGDMDLHFAWQAWHLVTWILTLRRRRGTYGAGLALVARLGRRGRRGRRDFLRDRRGTWRHGPSLCVAGVAVGDMDPHFAWQAHTHNLSSHNLTSTLTLRGRRGTWRHGPSLCVAAVALGDIDRHFAWQAWHLWHWAGSGGALGSQVSPWAPRLFAWQAWHLVTWTFTLRDSHTIARFTYNLLTHNLSTHNLTSTLTLRGRRGTWRHGPSLCVASVALGDMDPHFAW